MVGILGAALLGFVLTPFLEYGWHAWIGHARRDLPSRKDHLEHHRTAYAVRDPYEEIASNAPGVLGIAVLVALAGWAVVGVAVGAAFSVALVAGYAFSTIYHAQMHIRGPRTRYEEWMWRFHFHHHFGNPRVNFGLTNPIFDFVFGTAVVPDEVRVPRKLKPAWLDADRPGFKLLD